MGGVVEYVKWIEGWQPSEHHHISGNIEEAIASAQLIAIFYRKHYLVTRDGEGGWYVRPGSFAARTATRQ